ncbi:MAG TPA: M48 family metalloprotease [Myxococcales bacterium]|nr:M48 family metalloprotease [Myxococcales bacterium]
MLRIACAAAACAAAVACVRNPATGNLQLNLVSESQEIDMGKQAAQEVDQSLGLYKDPKIEAYVAKLGQSLAQHTERKNLPWQFHVVEDPGVNAFALPGGPVYVTRGILGTLTSEAQLAAVMGHECGHIAARHSANQISKAEVAQVGLGVGSVLSPELASLGQIASAGLQVLFLKFSRDDESQADKLGFAYMANDGYDPRQMVDVFKTLGRVSTLAGGSKVPEWLETHPDPENREKAAQERLSQLKIDFSTLKVNRDEYLAVIDGMVYGEDPRQGFFQGAKFLHPELKFQVTFPQGWKTQNTPQAVAAMSPKQDAILQLGGAGKLSPDEAASKFLSQQGIQRGQAAELNVNGQRAVASYFGAQTQQGQIAGLVAFVGYNGTTYGILGYTGAQTLQQYDPVFKSFISSFGPLTDPSALSVQPAKIQLTRIDSNMTVEQFNQRYPSNLRIEELALINGFDDKNGQMQAGKQYKRILGGPPVKDKPVAAAQPPKS